MNGFLLLILIIAAGIVILTNRKKRLHEQRQKTVRIAHEASSNGRSNTSRIVRPASSLPPIRSKNAAAQTQIKRSVQVPRLPSGKRKFENIYDFPHCPKCWSKNRRGETQVVFWQSDANCFRCARGHRFRRNGTLIL